MGGSGDSDFRKICGEPSTDPVTLCVRELRPAYEGGVSTSIVNDAGTGAVPTPFVTDIVYFVGGLTGRSLVLVCVICPLAVSRRAVGRARSRCALGWAAPGDRRGARGLFKGAHLAARRAARGDGRARGAADHRADREAA